MSIANLSLKHCNVLLCGCVIEVNDDRERVIFVKEERVVMEFLHHIANAVSVTVHGGVDPPTFLFRLFAVSHRHCHRNQRQNHQKKTDHGQHALH